MSRRYNYVIMVRSALSLCIAMSTSLDNGHVHVEGRQLVQRNMECVAHAPPNVIIILGMRDASLTLIVLMSETGKRRPEIVTEYSL